MSAQFCVLSGGEEARAASAVTERGSERPACCEFSLYAQEGTDRETGTKVFLSKKKSIKMDDNLENHQKIFIDRSTRRLGKSMCSGFKNSEVREIRNKKN